MIIARSIHLIKLRNTVKCLDSYFKQGIGQKCFESSKAQSQTLPGDAWIYDSVQEPKKNLRTNLEGIKMANDDARSALFPLINSLNVETVGKRHQLSVDCDNVVRLIKLGVMNTNISIQYCHYLAHLSRSKAIDEVYKAYYSKRAMNLCKYLIKPKTQTTSLSTILALLCDISDTTEDNIIQIYELINSDGGKLRKKLDRKSLYKLILSCYRFNQWRFANEFLDQIDILDTAHLLDPFIESLMHVCKDHKRKSEISGLDDPRQANSDDEILDDPLRSLILEHFYKLMNLYNKNRIYFVTKYNKELSGCLQKLGFKVNKRPVIKLSGRCTNCEEVLKLYDTSEIEKLNHTMRDILYATVKLDDGDLSVNSRKEDLSKFDSFLKELCKPGTRPIDIVIDGLNISYANNIDFKFVSRDLGDNEQRTVKQFNKSNLAQVLINTIIRSNLLTDFKKILVIGKLHMGNWPGLVDFFEKHNIHYYFSANDAKDDLFQIYAATLHPKTALMTNDYFRENLALFDEGTRFYLERWLETHQVWIIRKTLKAAWPTPIEKVPLHNKTTGNIHLPIMDSDKMEKFKLHQPPPYLNDHVLSWLCAKKRDDLDTDMVAI